MIRAVLIPLLTGFCLAVALVLGGCVKAGTLKGSGDIAPAPYGYTAGCLENPDAVMCPKKADEAAK